MSSINALPNASQVPQSANSDLPAAGANSTAPGLRKLQGALTATDGSERATASAQAAPVTQTLPALPMHQVQATASTTQAAHGVSMLSASNGGDGAFSAIMAYQVLFDAAQRQQNSANRARVAQQLGANNAARTAAEQQMTQVKADQSSSIFKFASGIGGAALPFGMIKRAAPENQSWITAVAPNAGQAFTSGMDAFDQNVGFGNTSLNAQIDQKVTDINKTIATQQAEGSTGVAKQGDSAVEMALRSLSEFFQRKSQTENTIANNV